MRRTRRWADPLLTDMGLSDASKAETVATSVNTLTSVLGQVGMLLPDIDQFGAIDDIEKGMIVSKENLEDALAVLAGFGLPAAVAAFVILKHKEVAP